MLKISLSRRSLRLLLIALIVLSAKMQMNSTQPNLAYYERLIPGVTTLVEAEAILGASTEMSSDKAKRTVEWTGSDKARIKAVFDKNGVLMSKAQDNLKF